MIERLINNYNCWWYFNMKIIRNLWWFIIYKHIFVCLSLSFIRETLKIISICRQADFYSTLFTPCQWVKIFASVFHHRPSLLLFIASNTPDQERPVECGSFRTWHRSSWPKRKQIQFYLTFFYHIPHPFLWFLASSFPCPWTPASWRTKELGASSSGQGLLFKIVFIFSVHLSLSNFKIFLQLYIEQFFHFYEYYFCFD